MIRGAQKWVINSGRKSDMKNIGEYYFLETAKQSPDARKFVHIQNDERNLLHLLWHKITFDAMFKI